MAVRVALDGDRCLADVGFGGLAPNRPLRLVEGEVQRDALADYRLLADALADEFGLCIDAADLDAVRAVVAERAAA